MFAGEQHGFRGAGAIRAALEGEMLFYGRVRTRVALAFISRPLGWPVWARAPAAGWLLCRRKRSRSPLTPAQPLT